MKSLGKKFNNFSQKIPKKPGFQLALYAILPNTAAF